MHVYLSGIGGAGLAALAQLAQDAGHTVSGSDLELSSNIQALQKRGVSVSTDQSGQAIEERHQELPIDWFVMTSALPKDAPELAFAQTHKIKVSKRDGLINYILADKKLKLIAVGGTHGKSTTSAMLVWLFKELGQPISYCVGTNLSFGPNGSWQSGSQYFIYEADEFDRNFLAFRPYISILPAVEYDHSDTYPTLKDYQAAFKQFIEQSHCSFLWADTAKSLGVAQHPCLHAVSAQSKEIDQVKLLGTQNRRNGYLALAAVKEVLGGNAQAVAETLNRFPGSERRMEKLAGNLYSSYAHLPTEIAADLELASEIGGKIVVAYQPHQNIRQHKIKDKYGNCFERARKVYWLPTYLSREDPDMEILEPKELVKNLADKHKTEIAQMNDDLVTKIKTHLKAGDTVIVMGAGSIDAWARKEFF